MTASRTDDTEHQKTRLPFRQTLTNCRAGRTDGLWASTRTIVKYCRLLTRNLCSSNIHCIQSTLQSPSAILTASWYHTPEALCTQFPSSPGHQDLEQSTRRSSGDQHPSVTLYFKCLSVLEDGAVFKHLAFHVLLVLYIDVTHPLRQCAIMLRCMVLHLSGSGKRTTKIHCIYAVLSIYLHF